MTRASTGAGPWHVVYEGFEPAEEGLREALCTLGNGYFATRGAAPESSADAVHYPGTYIAGCYDRLPSEVAGRTVSNEDLVNAPNWLPLTFRASGEDWFARERFDVSGYRQELDLRHGLLNRRLRYRGITKNDQWLHHRTAALNLRRLLALGLARNEGTWTLATG